MLRFGQTLLGCLSLVVVALAGCGTKGGGECPPAEANACGGCAELSESPGTACGTDAAPARWRCTALDEVRCVDDSANACGGESVLVEAPGMRCGACGGGVLECDGTDALRCAGADEGVNGCGGCSTLVGEPGDGCGPEGGVWECDGETAVRCSEPMNACGGFVPLASDVEGAELGEPCGACADGTFACDGPDRLRCIGATPANGCGGCGPLPTLPGEPCGPCDLGVQTCMADGTVACVGGREPNDCGGCGLLGAVPGADCGFVGRPATWRCQTPEQVGCIPEDTNACGGSGELSPPMEGDPPPELGALCGTCDRGTIGCDGLDATRCIASERGRNVCGGCDALQAIPGEVCGDCGGTWACDGGTVVCSLTRNVCGGCVVLPQEVGTTCAAGKWVCQGANAVVCGEPILNACGGTEPLTSQPGDFCGPCRDGRVTCIGNQDVACVGASELDVCGGCGVPPGVPGEPCAPGAAWQCSGTELVCVLGSGSNPCGGSAVLSAVPGSPCGSCDRGMWICDGADAVTCRDPGLVVPTSLFADMDGDGFGAAGTAEVQCPGPGWSANDLDCDDGDAFRRPDREEECDGKDNDCDDAVDEGLLVPWYVDADGDGAGTASAPVFACAAPEGMSRTADDCDDTRVDVLPGADEVCDGVDNDCDGLADDNAIDRSSWWLDLDGDGFGDARMLELVACNAPTADHVTVGGDCDDDDPDVSPAAMERCDFIDNDCDGRVDDDDPDLDPPPLYQDADGDGYGDPAVALSACFDVGFVDNSQDCDDTRRDVHPGAVEVLGDGIDGDCDGSEICYLDKDRDGFVMVPNPFAQEASCAGVSCLPPYDAPAPLDCSCTDCSLAPATEEYDCDDADATVNPGSSEVGKDCRV